MKLGTLVLAETDGGVQMKGILQQIEGKWARIKVNGQLHLVLTETLEAICTG